MTVDGMHPPGPIRQVPVGAADAGLYTPDKSPVWNRAASLTSTSLARRRADLRGSLRGRTEPSFPLPTTGAMAAMITTGPDGALWFTLNQAHAVGRLSIDGEATIYPLPTPDARPVGITATADAVWFVELWVALETGAVARVDI
ncbi:MAG: virginiamycin B lyase family protein [Pseudonocardiaceae bacterium]